MARKIIQFLPELIVIDEPEPNPDRVTLGGTKSIGIIQVNDKGSLLGTTSVQVSRSISRQPRMTDEKKAYRHAMRRFETTVFPNMPGYKYCSGCGDWVILKGFTADKRNRDGYQSHCKECHAAHEKMMYWHRKHTAIPMAA